MPEILSLELMPTFVHAVLTVDGKYALQLRDKHVLDSPDEWSFFGGSVENGEELNHALRREIREELELDIGRYEWLRRIRDCVFFVADVTEQWHKHVLHEGQAAGLFSYDEVKTIKRPQIVDDVLAIAEARSV